MRFGLFGTGPWAHQAHAPALAAHPDVELVGVWGRDPAKAATLAQEHGAKPYAEIDDLIADVDAVAVALPPDVQADIALRAARAGKHLLLDKPVAFTPEAAAEIVAAAAEQKVSGVVFFTRRFMRNPLGVVGLAIVVVLLLCAAFAPLLSEVEPVPRGEDPWRAPAVEVLVLVALSVGLLLRSAAGRRDPAPPVSPA